MKLSSISMMSSPISSVPISLLDLAQIPEGGTAQTALHRSRELAQHAERLGFHRFWLAEHHNMQGIASAATSLAIGFVAEGTSTIRVGAGGIMLPNHAPLVIAEQFGTLDALYPGRIDLGVGRAPGSDQATMRALRRDHTSADSFPSDVQELQALLGDPARGQHVQAVPGAGSHVPVWILGSSLYGAQLAAALGLPYAFASHFAPAALAPAIQVYRESFRPSAELAQPHVMLAANVIVADDDDEATRLFTSMQRSFIDGAFRRQRSLLPPPMASIDDYWQPHERAEMQNMLSCSFIGSPDTVRAGLDGFVAEHAPDELIVTTSAYDQAARLYSIELLAGLGIGAAVAPR
jgi:luciferase family oxidoreductase group 1